jgi:hypothetical protein
VLPAVILVPLQRRAAGQPVAAKDT